MPDPWSKTHLLAIDTTSPVLSVALGSPGCVLAHRSEPAARSSAKAMRLIDDCLAAESLAPRRISALVVLRGPGSFTGIRVGLALAQGLRQALGIAAGTLSSFEALAATADGRTPILAAVASGRDTWRLQRFDGPTAEGNVTTASDADLLVLAQRLPVIGFGLDRLSSEHHPGADLRLPPALASAALAIASSADWDPAGLTKPLYLAPPPADPRAATRH